MELDAPVEDASVLELGDETNTLKLAAPASSMQDMAEAEPVELAIEEADEIELGAEEATPIELGEVDVCLDDADHASEADQVPDVPDYPVGGQSVILLSEMLTILNLDVGHIVNVAQVIEDDASPVYIQIEKVGEEYEIRPLGAFDAVEIAIETEDDVVLIQLVESWGHDEATDKDDAAIESENLAVDAGLGQNAIDAGFAPEAAVEEDVAELSDVDSEAATLVVSADEAEVEAAKTHDAEPAPDEIEVPLSEINGLALTESAAGQTPEEAPETIQSAYLSDETRDDAALSYVFGEEKSVMLTNILEALGVNADLSEYEMALSEESAIEVEVQEDPRDYLLTATNYFDAITLTLTADENTLAILLSNPAEVINMAAGDSMTSENGAATVVFEEAVALPEGTELTAEASEPDLDAATKAEIEARLKETLGDTPFEVIWYDVALGDVHDVQATLTLAEAAEADDQVIVVHVHDDDVKIIEDVTVGDTGAVTFPTDGFSPIGVVRLLGAASDALYTFEDGVLTIHSSAAMKANTSVPWYNNSDDNIDSLSDITDIVIEDGVGITTIPQYFLNSSYSTCLYPNLKTVTIPKSVTSIGSYAFRKLDT